MTSASSISRLDSLEIGSFLFNQDNFDADSDSFDHDSLDPNPDPDPFDSLFYSLDPLCCSSGLFATPSDVNSDIFEGLNSLLDDPTPEPHPTPIGSPHRREEVESDRRPAKKFKSSILSEEETRERLLLPTVSLPRPPTPSFTPQAMTAMENDVSIALVNKGFHAYQKSEKKENTKALSFSRGQFVTNQNKTAILYFIVNKSEGSIPCYLEMLASKENDQLDFKVLRKRGRVCDQIRNNKTAACLYRIVKTDDDVIPCHINVVGNMDRDLDGQWGSVYSVCERGVRRDKRDFRGQQLPLLASGEINLPVSAGKYIIMVYPLMGLYTKKVEMRTAQNLCLYFPTTSPTASGDEFFSIDCFKMVSRESSKDSSINKGVVYTTSTHPGMKRKRSDDEEESYDDGDGDEDEEE
jgi:hypothetical protein